jgi:hypothetical protein
MSKKTNPKEEENINSKEQDYLSLENSNKLEVKPEDSINLINENLDLDTVIDVVDNTSTFIGFALFLISIIIMS